MSTPTYPEGHPMHGYSPFPSYTEPVRPTDAVNPATGRLVVIEQAELERDEARARAAGRCACDCPEDGSDPASWCEFHERIRLAAEAATASLAAVRTALAAVCQAIHRVQDWSGTRVGDCLDAADVLLDAPDPGAATWPEVAAAQPAVTIEEVSGCVEADCEIFPIQAVPRG